MHTKDSQGDRRKEPAYSEPFVLAVVARFGREEVLLTPRFAREVAAYAARAKEVQR